MSLQAKRTIARFLIFACIGLLIEVFFTSLGGLRHGDFNLRGHTSPWMMLDYGLLGVVTMPIARALTRLGAPLVLRAAVYMLGIFFIEFVSGWLFDLCHIRIWDYSHLRLNLCGYITLMYAPFWYALGLGVEYLYKKVDAAALMLARGWDVSQLESFVSSGTTK